MLFTRSHVPDIGWKYTGAVTGMFLYGSANAMYFLYTVGGGDVLLLGLVGTALATGVGALCNVLYFFPWGPEFRFLLPGALHGALTLLNYGDGNATDLTFFGSIALVNLGIGAGFFVTVKRSRQRTN